MYYYMDKNFEGTSILELSTYNNDSSSYATFDKNTDSINQIPTNMEEYKDYNYENLENTSNNKHLDDYYNNIVKNTDSLSSENSQKQHKKDNNIIKNYVNDNNNDYMVYIYELLLIIILYIILSQPYVLKFFQQFIKQLVPDKDFQISMIGLFIYGMIFGLLFIFIKKFLFSKFIY